jgi:hypothetical protein
MSVDVINLISSRQAVATVNEWLVCHLGDRFLAGTPVHDGEADLWRVPVLYVYPNQGPLGVVGEIALDAATGELQTQPAIEEVKQRAMKLYQSRSESQDSALPPSGD